MPNNSTTAATTTTSKSGGNPNPKKMGSKNGKNDGNRPKPKFSRTAVVPVDEEHVGFVLGKGGQTIKEIQKITNTTISHRVANPEKGFHKECFWIGGHRELNVYMARVTIQDLINTVISKDKSKENSN